MQMLDRRTLEQAMRDLGVDHWGLTQTDTLHEAADFLDQWLKQQKHGSMQWLGKYRDIRREPEKLMEGGRTILMIALPYSPHFPETGAEHDGDPEPRYKISRYVTEEDYHHVLKTLLYRILETFKKQDPEMEGRVFCDTAPVFEKELARRAGLGWIGKHSNLIHPRRGSWFFLGGMLLNRDISAFSEMIPDHCGSCSRCQAACPTGALDTAYELNAALCISYLTIENRDSVLPAQLDLKDWIYGCDICQEVCPWNLKFSAEPAVQGLKSLTSLQLRTEKEWEQMGETAYKKVTRRTAMSRQSYTGIMRNIAHSRQRRAGDRKTGHEQGR